MRVVSAWLAVAVVGQSACDRSDADQRPAATGSRLGAWAPESATVGRSAARLAQYKEHAEGVPCPSYPAAVEVMYGEFVFRFEQPILAAGEGRLPWIPSSTERVAVANSGARVLIVPVTIKNTAPVAKSPPQGIALITPDGVSHGSWTYNAKLWSTQHGRATFWELGQLKPDEWVKTAFVFPVDASDADRSLLYLARTGYVRDGQGYSHRVLYEHAVAELSSAIAGDPIQGR